MFQLKMMSVDLPIPDALQSQFPPKINSKLRAWMSVDLEQYNALSVTQHLRDGDAVTGNDFFFRLQVGLNGRISSCLELFVALLKMLLHFSLFILRHTASIYLSHTLRSVKARF